MRFQIAYIAIGLLTWAGANAAAPELVTAALQNTGVSDFQNWSFTRTSKNNDNSAITERFTPGLRNHWELLSINGEVPTDSQKREYLENADERKERNHPADLSPDGFIDLQSFRLVNEDGNIAQYEFSLEGGDEPEMNKHLVGLMSISKKGRPYISEVSIKSRSAFSPKMGIRIINLTTHMYLAPIQKGGPAFITTLSEQMEGKALGVIPMADSSHTSFGDFKRQAVVTAAE